MVFDDNYARPSGRRVSTPTSGLKPIDIPDVQPDNGPAATAAGPRTPRAHGSDNRRGRDHDHREQLHEQRRRRPGRRATSTTYATTTSDRAPTFSGNNAAVDGGGVRVDDLDGPPASLTIRGSTFTDNSADVRRRRLSRRGRRRPPDRRTRPSRGTRRSTAGEAALYDDGRRRVAIRQSSTIREPTAGNFRPTDPYGGGGIYLYEDDDGRDSRSLPKLARCGSDDRRRTPARHRARPRQGVHDGVRRLQSLIERHLERRDHRRRQHHRHRPPPRRTRRQRRPDPDPAART